MIVIRFMLFGLLLCLSPSYALALTLSGTITGDGSPLAGAEVSLIDSSSSREIEQYETDSDGLYSFDVVDGAYRLEIIAPEGSGLGTTNVNDIEVNGSDIVRNVALIGRVEFNTISGTISLSDGTPVSGARLSASPQSDGQSDYTTTDENGAYSMSLISGVYRFHLQADFENDDGTSSTTYQDNNFAQDIDVAEDVLQSFTVPSLISVSGTTKDSNGVAVANASIGATFYSYSEETFDTDTYVRASTTSDEQGNYELLLVPEVYSVTIVPDQEDSSHGRTYFSGLEFSEPTVYDLVVDQVTRNTISGTISLSDGTPVSGARLSASPQSDGQSDYTTTDENGAYSMSLISGVYRFHLQADFENDDGTSSTTYQDNNFAQDIDVAEDVLQSFTVPSLISVSGTTKDSNGVAVANASIGATFYSYSEETFDTDTYVRASTTSDEQGNYELLLVPEVYSVTIVPDQEDSSHGRTYFSGLEFSEPTVYDLVVDQVTRNTISGTISLSDGTPVSGARLSASPQSDGQSDYTTTDENGAYSMSLISGVYRFHLQGRF